MNEIDILEKMAYEPPIYLENAEPLTALHFDKIKAEYRAKDLQKDLKNIFFIESKYYTKDDKYIFSFKYINLEFEIWTTYKDTASARCKRMFYLKIKNSIYEYEYKKDIIKLFINIICMRSLQEEVKK